jgi:hypothetical protein
MLGFTVQSLESLLVSHLQCAASYDWGNPPTHTNSHRRSTLYIYKVFQHLLQWLVVIRGCNPNIDICSMGPRVDVIGVGGTFHASPLREIQGISRPLGRAHST